MMQVAVIEAAGNSNNGFTNDYRVHEKLKDVGQKGTAKRRRYSLAREFEFHYHQVHAYDQFDNQILLLLAQ